MYIIRRRLSPTYLQEQMLSPGKRLFMTELSPSRLLKSPLAKLTAGSPAFLNNGLQPQFSSPLKISPVLTPNTIAKTRSTVKSLIDFDTDCKMRPTKRLVSIEPPTVFSKIELNQLNQLKKLCTFSETEMDLLINLFFKKYNAQTGQMSPSVYWALIGKVSPFLYKDSMLRTQLSYIFQTRCKESFTPIEFILSIAVLYQRAKFMSSEELVYDVLNRDNTGILDISIFSDLSTCTGSDLLFIVQHPGGKLEITRTMFIDTWKRYIDKYTHNGQMIRDTFVEVLRNNSCSNILTYPFYINGALEALCE